MRIPSPLPILVLCLVAFGGCVGSQSASGGGAAATSEAGQAEAPSFDDDTGALGGVVVDDQIQPIANALVGIKENDAKTTSDANGRFTLNKLAPGTYTVLANALGYESQGKQIEIVAGKVAEIRFVLVSIPTEEPFPDLQTFSGLIECAWGLAGAGSGNCLPIQSTIQQYGLPNPTGTKIIGLFAIKDPQKVVQGVFEMTWDPSAAFTSGQLLLAVELEKTGIINGKVYGQTQGKSPLRVVTDDTPYKELKPDQKLDKVQTRTFPAGTNPPTLVANQRFTVYATACYFAECPELYSAVKDS